MPVTGEIKYEGYRVFLTGGVLSVNLLMPPGTLEDMGFLGLIASQVPPLGLIVDSETQEGGKEFADLLGANQDDFRLFLIENIPRRISTVGIIVMEGGAIQSATGEITFEGEFRRPNTEDYAALDKFTAIIDKITEEAVLEHCKSCATCAEAEGLPIPEGAVEHGDNANILDFPGAPLMWGSGNNTDDDDQVH